MRRLILVLFLAFFAADVAESSPKRLRTESRDGVTYVHLNDLLRAVNGTKQFDPMTRTTRVWVEGVEFRVLDGSEWVTSGEKSWALGAPVSRDTEAIWVPESFIARVLAGNVGSTLRLSGNRLYVNSAPGVLRGLSARDVQEGIELELAGRFPAPPQLRVDSRRVRIVLPTCEAGALSTPELDDDFIESLSITQEGDGVVVDIALGKRALGYSWRDRGSDRIRFILGHANDLVSFDQRPPRKRGGVRRVVLDPSHGGRDFGAWLAGGLREKWVTLELVRIVADSLRANGYEVYLTRNEDRGLSPESRAALANETRADLYISFDLENNVAAGSPDVTCGVHVSDGDRQRALSVAGRRLVAWGDVQRSHLDESEAFAEWLLRTSSDGSGKRRTKPLRLPLRSLMGVDMPAVQVLISKEVTEVEIWRQWRSGFAQSVVEAVSGFGRRRW